MVALILARSGRESIASADAVVPEPNYAILRPRNLPPPRWDPMATAVKRQRFSLILVKPSHYDDDGYVIQWLRSAIPSNSLAVLYGLALDSIERKVLGEDVEIVITALDETNTRIRPEQLAREIGGGRGMVGLVGVQSNQFPRAMDIARRLRALGVQVCIGGFHVSGSLAMLPTTPPELQEAMASLSSGGSSGSMAIVPETWKPPTQTGIPRALSGRAMSIARGNSFDCTPTKQTSPRSLPNERIIRSGRTRVLVSSMRVISISTSSPSTRRSAQSRARPKRFASVVEGIGERSH